MNDDKPDNETASTSGGENTPDAVKRNVQSRSTWLRLFFMLVITFIYGVTRVVIAAVVMMQFFWVLFTASTNENLKRFGQQLASYTYQIIRFLTFNTEERPFPFELEWPDEK